MKHHLFNFSKGIHLNNDSLETSKQFEETEYYLHFDTKECQLKVRGHLLHAEECFGKLPGHHLVSPVVPGKQH